MTDTDSINFTINVTTCVMGTIMFITNLIIVVIICRLLFTSTTTNKDRFGVLVQTAAVSINDVLSGFVLVILGFIKVNSQFEAYLCTYIQLSSVALQIVSQGNIACICMQRFIITRRQSNVTSTQTRALIAVNVVIGLASLVSFGIIVKVKPITDIPTNLCSLSAVTQADTTISMAAYFVLGVLFTLVADIFCLITVKRLMTNDQVSPEPKNIQSTDQNVSTSSKANKELTETEGAAPRNTTCGQNTSNGSKQLGETNTSSGSRDDSQTIRATTRLRQRKATVTLFLILFFVNLSIMPTLFSFIIAFFGVYVQPNIRRAIYVWTFLNSMVNPIIIACRVEYVKTSLTTAIYYVLDKITKLRNRLRG